MRIWAWSNFLIGIQVKVFIKFLGQIEFVPIRFIRDIINYSENEGS